MRHIFVLLISAFISIQLAAQVAPAPAPANPWLKTTKEKLAGQPQCMTEVAKTDIMSNLEKFQKTMTDGYEDGKPIISSHYKSFASVVNDWMRDYKYLDLDTNISREWFVKLTKLFELLYRYRRDMEIAEAKKDNKALEEAKKKYEYYVDVYAKQLKEPEKTPRHTRERLEVEKTKEFRAYREYLRKQKENE